LISVRYFFVIMCCCRLKTC